MLDNNTEQRRIIKRWSLLLRYVNVYHDACFLLKHIFILNHLHVRYLFACLFYCLSRFLRLCYINSCSIFEVIRTLETYIYQQTVVYKLLHNLLDLIRLMSSQRSLISITYCLTNKHKV